MIFTATRSETEKVYFPGDLTEEKKKALLFWGKTITFEVISNIEHLQEVKRKEGGGGCLPTSLFYTRYKHL